MKNMKKIVALAVALLVVLSVSLLAVACGSDEENGGTTETTANQNTTVTTQGGGSTDTTVGGTTTTTQGGGTTDTSKPTTGTSGNGGTDDSGNAGDDLKENEVKVTVRYENGRPVNGATVQICQGSQCFFMPIVTGTNGVGVGEYDLNGDALKAKVNSIKTNDGIDYLIPADEGYVYFEEDSRELVITIKLLTINVFDNNPFLFSPNISMN